MTVARIVLLASLIALLGWLPGCSMIDSNRKEKMLSSAPPGYEVQLITLTVVDRQYGRLAVEQTVVDLLARREGILEVKRGAGREELFVLAEAHVDPYMIPRTVPDRFTVRILEVEKPDPKIP